MRGDGSIFLRGRIWWIAYSFRGRPYQESSKSADEKIARKLLRQRMKKLKPGFIDPVKEEKLTLDDLKQCLISDYRRKNNRSLDSLQYCFQHLEAELTSSRLVDIDAKKVQEYADKRLKAEAARASINRELGYLRRGFKLLAEAGSISTVPVIKLFDETGNVRQGFIDVGDFMALLEKIEDTDVRDIVEFLYHSGWRSGEAKSFVWGWIDGNMIRLPAEYSKNKKPRSLPIVGTLEDVIERRQKLRRLDCGYVFHRSGKPIKSFRKAFKAAAKEIGYPDLLPHDMRRSAVRNFRRSGLSESDGMELSGHRTRSVYARYNIIVDEDKISAMDKVQKHLKKEAENRKVVQLKRETA